MHDLYLLGDDQGIKKVKQSQTNSHKFENDGGKTLTVEKGKKITIFHGDGLTTC